MRIMTASVAGSLRIIVSMYRIMGFPSGMHFKDRFLPSRKQVDDATN